MNDFEILLIDASFSIQPVQKLADKKIKEIYI